LVHHQATEADNLLFSFFSIPNRKPAAGIASGNPAVAWFVGGLVRWPVGSLAR
jgi:hypothetical protein